MQSRGGGGGGHTVYWSYITPFEEVNQTPIFRNSFENIPFSRGYYQEQRKMELYILLATQKLEAKKRHFQ